MLRNFRQFQPSSDLQENPKKAKAKMGYGAKINQKTAGSSPCFHLPVFHSGYTYCWTTPKWQFLLCWETGGFGFRTCV